MVAGGFQEAARPVPAAGMGRQRYNSYGSEVVQISNRIVDLDEERLRRCLGQVYQIQMRNCFPDEIVPEIMEKIGLDEEGAIELIKSFIRMGWISTGNVREKFFLRPGYIRSFPVVISALGLEKIK